MRPAPALAEHELTALWLLGRAPAGTSPWPLLRAGRAGRGPGPDVREAAFVRSGVPVCGDIEVHVLASDFDRHGHGTDPAYAGIVLHLVWSDDRPPESRGGAQALPLGGSAPTVAVGPLLGGQPRRLRALLARGPSGGEPCRGVTARDPGHLVATLRREGRRRLAERAWQAGALAVQHGWTGAWTRLLERALTRSAGRHPESLHARAALMESITAGLGAPAVPIERALTPLAGDREALVAALRADGSLGAARAAEVGWNAALPLLIALATAYEDLDLARRTARLAAAWPAPRPYGRTRALESQLLDACGDGGPSRRAGALWAQGLLHLQDLWCSRGGCGACPLSAPGAAAPLPAVRSDVVYAPS